MSTDQPALEPILLLPPPDSMNMDESNNTGSWLSSRSNGTSNGHGNSKGGDDADMDEGKTDVDSDVMGTQTVQLRKYGSGLGNLGNTCFMNSSIQCLAHTSPLQEYFLSNEYEADLNRDNPLGTGGELATEFAELMAEMWGTSASCQRRSVFPSSSSYNPDTSLVVYPRNFKYTLGKHAEQFMGYDQHDSQELATYLLDALHEDTNRVTKKPYVEKPEQGEDESDEEASKNAWQLHLQREDSSVLQHFMGQVKSRVQCSEAGCGRVSTTFDPFMYLSVPIPGSSERTLRVSYVPLDPLQRAKSVSVTISKAAAMLELLKKVKGQLEKHGLIDPNTPFCLEDLCPVDVWQKEIYSWYENTHDIDRIRDNDETFVYQLRPLAEVQAIAADIAKDADDDATSSIIGLRSNHRSRRYQVDVGTMTRINRENEWTNELSNYLRNHLGFLNAFNPKKGSTGERVTYYQRFINFIDLCLQEAEGDVAGQKRTREENGGAVMTSPGDEELPLLIARSDSSQYFKNVRTRWDVAVLEFLAAKMRTEIVRIEQAKKQAHPNGILIQVRMRKIGTISMAKDQTLAAPFVLRIASNMSVYALREEIARRLGRSIKTRRPAPSPSWPGQATSELEVESMLVNGSAGTESGSNDLNSFGSPELLVVRQIPLSFERKSSQTYKSYTASSRQLGSVEKRGNQGYNGSRPTTMASSTDSDEKDLVAELVGNEGTVFMDWPVELCESSFDSDEYENVEDANSSDGDEAVAARTRASNTTNVLDCIEKFCAMEQLEETEMWYCNRCQKHVQAWKQFHVYRAPPILIVHLKRFQYSASTHRRDKIGVFIDFPLEGLDLTEQAMHWTTGEKPIYDCYAVSNHYGGLGGGHYTAYALNDDGVWCHYDDSRVTSHVDPKEVISQAAYVLYYRRRDVQPVGPDFLANMQTSSSLRPPNVIRDPLDKATETSEVSSSNAAMIDEDDTMEVDVTDVGSRCTSPMGSTGDATEPFVDHEYDTEEGTVEEGGIRPLQ
jgi:ubiquitin carboxyl-terminal hydrolase 4/11/15